MVAAAAIKLDVAIEELSSDDRIDESQALEEECTRVRRNAQPERLQECRMRPTYI